MLDAAALPQWLLALLAALALALGAWLALRARRSWKRWLLLRRMRRARNSERGARAWLEANGFRILEEQSTRAAQFVVDGTTQPFIVRADYLVERDGVRAVVEVKTGAVADPANRATRRQVLEYAWVYDVDAVYLFDADAGRLLAIRVPSAGPAQTATRGRRSWLPVVIALAAGLALGLTAAFYWYR